MTNVKSVQSCCISVGLAQPVLLFCLFCLHLCWNNDTRCHADLFSPNLALCPSSQKSFHKKISKYSDNFRLLPLLLLKFKSSGVILSFFQPSWSFYLFPPHFRVYSVPVLKEQPILCLNFLYACSCSFNFYFRWAVQFSDPCSCSISVSVFVM